MTGTILQWSFLRACPVGHWKEVCEGQNWKQGWGRERPGLGQLPHLQEALGGFAGQQVVLGVGDVFPRALLLEAHSTEVPILVQSRGEHLMNSAGSLRADGVYA